MLTAALYGLGTSLPLLVGAAIGLRYDLPRPLLAGLMAFGSGTMLAAVTTELFQPAFEADGLVVAGTALMAGCLLASARAAAGRPVIPRGMPDGARLDQPPFARFTSLGAWTIVALEGGGSFVNELSGAPDGCADGSRGTSNASTITVSR